MIQRLLHFRIDMNVSLPAYGPALLISVPQSGVGALCFLAWDTVIHLADEVEFIWSGPNTWVKFIYIFIRYFPLLTQGTLLIIITSYFAEGNFSVERCRTWVICEVVFIEALTFAVEITLVIRVYALYNQTKAVLWALSLLFCAEVATMIVSLALSVPGMQFNPQCFVMSAPDIFMAYWLSSLAFETILFGLTLVSFFSYMKHGFGTRSLLYVFMRDGTWAYAVIFANTLLDTVMYKLNDVPFVGVLFFCWAPPAISFAGAHVLMGLRRHAVRSISGPSINAGSALPLGFAFAPPDRSGDCV